MNQGDVDPKDLLLYPNELGVGLGHGPQQGRIMLVLPRASKWVALDPQQACAVAKDMIDKSVQLGFQVTLMIPRKPISQEARSRIVNRVRLVMQDLNDRKRDPRFVAEELVDIVLRDSGA